MNPPSGTNPFLRRLLWSLMIVIGSSLATMSVGTIAQALWAPWFWPALALDSAFPKSAIDLVEWPKPLAGTCCTAVILAIGARSRFATILIVLWFELNVLGVFWFHAVYDGHS